jgi:site-specific DNA recombinase
MAPRQPRVSATDRKVGVWVRVSTEDQVKGESPEHHERRARLYAESKGWRVATVFNLEAVSGKSVMHHPETQRMLDDIRSGKISAIIFSKLARLARNTRELLEFADIFRQHDADLVSLQESIDTSSPAGRLFYTMIAAMAQWEREEIAERVAASVPIRAKLGKPLGGAAPFGYRWEGRELRPDPKDAPIRRRVHELFDIHKRKKTVARLLNEEGYRTRNGSKFSDTTVDRLIRDPTAKGIRRANYTKSTGDKKHWTLKPESDWVLTPVEAIVPEELWDRCNAVLAERAATGKRPAKRTVHIFTGLAHCECGPKMYVASGTTKYACRKCGNKIPADDLEAIFREQLREFFLSSEELGRCLEQADEEVAGKSELLASLEADRAKVKAEMDKVYRLHLADQISQEGFGQLYRPLEERLAAIEDELPRLQAELDFLRIQNLSRDEIVAEAQDLYGRWTDLLPAEKRQIVENVVERITVGKTGVAIDLAYFPPSVGNSSKKATPPHGFIAATNITCAGNVVVRLARAMCTTPCSSGCRNVSSTRRLNSGSSSRKSTPPCARLSSPGRGTLPPPTSAMSEHV